MLEARKFITLTVARRVFLFKVLIMCFFIPQITAQKKGGMHTVPTSQSGPHREMPRLVSLPFIQRGPFEKPSKYDVCFSADGKLLATAGMNELTQVWEVDTGRLLRSLPADVTYANGDVTSPMTFSNDNEWLARGFENHLKIFSVSTGRIVLDLKTSAPGADSSGGIQTVALSNNKKTLTVIQSGARLGFWDELTIDTATRRITSKRPIKAVGQYEFLLAPLDLSLEKAEARLKALGGEFEAMKTKSYELAVVAITKKGDLIALRQMRSDSDPNKPETEAEVENAEMNTLGPVELRFSKDAVVRIIRPTDGREISRLQGYSISDVPAELAWRATIETEGNGFTSLEAQVRNEWRVSWTKSLDVVFSANNACIVFNIGQGSDSFAEVVEWPSGNLLKRVEQGVIAISDDGKFAVTAPDDINVLNLEDKTTIATFPAHDENLLSTTGQPVLAAAFSNDNALLGLLQADVPGFQEKGDHGHILIWDIAKRRERLRIALPKNVGFADSSCLTFSPNGKLLTAAFFNALGAAELWLFDVQTGRLKNRLRGHKGDIVEVKFSPDGRFIATNSFDHTARVWITVTGKERFRINEPGDQLQFSSNGQYIFSNSVLNRLDDGSEVCRFYTLANRINAIVAPDGRFEVNDLENVKGLHWVIPSEPYKTIPIEIFMRNYFEPDLLARLLKCNKDGDCDTEFKPLPPIGEINRVQPKVGKPTRSAAVDK